MSFGTIIGYRELSGVSKSQKPYHFYELSVRMAEIPASRGQYYGVPIEQFVVFDNALAGYRPRVGEGVRYALFQQGQRTTCGFVIHEPAFDDSELLDK